MKNRIAALSLTLALSVGLCAPAQAADSQTVQATLNAGITVTMDGTPQTFHDAQGAVVLPLTYNGTTYLPVRAVCGLVGLPVEWVQETSTVKMGNAIPEGALAITERSQLTNATGAMPYPGGFHLDSRTVHYGGSNIGITTKGYATITLTFKASDKDTLLTASARLLGNSIWDPCETREVYIVPAGETQTLTFDCSGTEDVGIRIERDDAIGNFAEGWITNIYLLP